MNVVITGDARQLGKATDQAGRHMDDVGKRSAKMGSALKVGFGAAVAGAGLLVVGLKQTVDAAIDAEASNARLQAQLKASGISYRAHSKEIENVIQKTSQLAALDDEDLQDAFTNIVRATGSVNAGLKNMGLVADLARAKHLDVARAGDIVAKVLNGNVTALRRYGIAVTPVTKAQDALRESTKHATVEQTRAAKEADKTATAQQALATLQKRFAGQAEAYGKTAAGAQERFGVAVENLKEMLGTALLPTVTRVTNAVSKFVNEMQTGTGAGGGFARSMHNVADSIDDVSHQTSRVIGWINKHEKAANSLATAIGAPLQQLKGLVAILKGVKSAGDAVVSVFKSIGHAAGDVAGAVKGAAGALNPLGDGLGQIKAPSIPNFGGDLMGARPSLAPFAAAGSRFGLHVSSGRRPGAITSSGNVSYHSSGEAIDMAGSPAGMLGFFRQMKNTAGSRLAELIYTPGGVGVKDGHPFTYTGQVARDHYDHVHVAYDTGVPGVGDGLGFRALEDLWYKAGGAAKLAPLMAHIAQAESGGDPIARNPSGASGLWQILGQPFKGNVFDPLTNAKMAVWKYQHQGLGAWAASRGTWGRYVGSGETYTPGGSRGSGGSGGSGTKKHPSMPTITGGTNIPTKPPTYEQIDTALGLAVEEAGGQDNPAALNALVDQRRALSDRATKIRAALRKKGLRPETRQRLQAELTGLIGRARDMDAQIGALRNPQTDTGTSSGEDPNQPLIDAQNAAKEAADALRDQIKDLQKSIDAQTDFAKDVSNTSNYQLTKTLSDLLSGHIVGYGVAGRAFTPGTGVEVAY